MMNPEAASGNYWIKPRPDRQPVHVYCDMETQDGMWALVYRYTFTNYKNFYTLVNAVSPRPAWPASEADVQISTDSPTVGLGAVDYSLWEYIGSSFMITSNINDWIVCYPGTGSLVTPVNGSIACTNFMDVTTNCSGTPSQIVWTPCGPRLYHRNTMYFFDGSSTSCFPTHNSCDDSWKNNYKKGVADPHGSIYLKS